MGDSIPTTTASQKGLPAQVEVSNVNAVPVGPLTQQAAVIEEEVPGFLPRVVGMLVLKLV